MFAKTLSFCLEHDDIKVLQIVVSHHPSIGSSLPTLNVAGAWRRRRAVHNLDLREALFARVEMEQVPEQ